MCTVTPSPNPIKKHHVKYKRGIWASANMSSSYRTLTTTTNPRRISDILLDAQPCFRDGKWKEKRKGADCQKRRQSYFGL